VTFLGGPVDDAADIFLCRYDMRAFFGRFCSSFQNVSPNNCNALFIIINNKVPKTKVMKVDSILFARRLVGSSACMVWCVVEKKLRE
jgi:hypothetical protein